MDPAKTYRAWPILNLFFYLLPRMIEWPKLMTNCDWSCAPNVWWFPNHSVFFKLVSQTTWPVLPLYGLGREVLEVIGGIMNMKLLGLILWGLVFWSCLYELKKQVAWWTIIGNTHPGIYIYIYIFYIFNNKLIWELTLNLKLNYRIPFYSQNHSQFFLVALQFNRSLGK